MTSLGHHHLHQFVTLEKATTQQMTCIQTVFTSVHELREMTSLMERPLFLSIAPPLHLNSSFMMLSGNNKKKVHPSSPKHHRLI